jgi:hypothetical protein
MPKFQIGETVRRIAMGLPDYMQAGVVAAVRTRVTEEAIVIEYVVNFEHITMVLDEDRLLSDERQPPLSHIPAERLHAAISNVGAPLSAAELDHVKSCDICLDRFTGLVRTNSPL